MKYFLAILRHKWFVFLASLRIGAPFWPAVFHDWSKFLPSEFPHYNRQFFGDKGDGNRFAHAWLHHQNCNDHHWQWWITRATQSYGKEQSEDGCLPMSNGAILHMIADWMAVRRDQFGTWDESRWKRPVGLYDAKVHPRTRGIVLFQLRRLGLYKQEDK
jgi:hypothetical protein